MTTVDRHTRAGIQVVLALIVIALIFGPIFYGMYEFYFVPDPAPSSGAALNIPPAAAPMTASRSRENEIHRAHREPAPK